MAFDIGRRQFISALGGATVVWPLAARAQQSTMPTVGFVHGASKDYIERMAVTFRQGLKEAGFIEGQNVAIEYRWADGHNERLPGLIADLISRKVAVLVAAGGNEPAHVAMAATTTIPVVFVSATDPVSGGLVTSLNRPGGNVTGVSMLGVALEAKRLEILHQLVPKASIVAALIDPNYPGSQTQTQELQDAATHLGVKLVVLNPGTELEIEPAFAAALQQGAGAVLVAQDALYVSQRGAIVVLTARYAIPAIYSQRDYVAVGGLISYGTDFAEGYRPAGVYVGRILKGEKPADLPVLQPTKFDTVINLKTANALGLEIPATLLAIADEVIE